MDNDWNLGHTMLLLVILAILWLMFSGSSGHYDDATGRPDSDYTTDAE